MEHIFHDLHSVEDRGAIVYLLSSPGTGLLIDSGFEETPGKLIFPLLDELGITSLSTICLTHGHGDHYEGCGKVKERFPARIAVHRLDAPLIRYKGDRVLFQDLNVRYPGSFPVPETLQPVAEADLLLEDGDKLAVGDFELEVLHTPGHSEGSLCFYDARRKILFSGDTVGGDSVHFYCAPKVLDKSLERLSRLDIDFLLPAHAYPPEKKNRFSGKEVAGFFRYSRDAIARAQRGVKDIQAKGKGRATPQEITEELPGVTLIAAIKILESLGSGAG